MAPINPQHRIHCSVFSTFVLFLFCFIQQCSNIIPSSVLEGCSSQSLRNQEFPWLNHGFQHANHALNLFYKFANFLTFIYFVFIGLLWDTELNSCRWLSFSPFWFFWTWISTSSTWKATFYYSDSLWPSQPPSQQCSFWVLNHMDYWISQILFIFLLEISILVILILVSLKIRKEIG